MAATPALTLHALALSHPCLCAVAALEYKGLEFERIDLPPGEHTRLMAEIYGDANTTVPGLMVGGDPVHGSVAILDRLEQIAPDPTLYPEAIADKVREAERWGDDELQDLGRRLPFGAMHFRPEAMGTFGGGEPLNPAATGFAMKYIHGAWRYHGITAERLAEDLAGLPAKLDHVRALAADGVIGGEQPNAADLQIACTLRVLLTVGDLRPLLAGEPERIARRWYPDYAGDCPAGAFPAGWVPEPA